VPLILSNCICLGTAHSPYCHSKAIPQEAIRNTRAGPAGLEFGNTGENSGKSEDLICLASNYKKLRISSQEGSFGEVLMEISVVFRSCDNLNMFHWNVTSLYSF
jgi:hypothetical protein